MVRHAWVGFGAVAFGAAIAMLLGGRSLVGAVLTAATLVVALIATAASRLKQRQNAAPIDHVRIERQQLEQERFDDDLRARLREVVGERDIDWLGRQDFDVAWRETPVLALRHLTNCDAFAQAPFGDELRQAVASLEFATMRFLEFYERNTRSDSLLAGTDWREVGSITTEDGAEDAVPAQLVELAAAVVAAHNACLHPAGRARQALVAVH